MSSKVRNLIGALDQGTQSTRFLVFDCDTAEVVASHQAELQLQSPQPGFVETDASAVLDSAKLCLNTVYEEMTAQNLDPALIKGIGIANQRLTIVAWDKFTGKPLHNAILWMDVRTKSHVSEVVKKTGKLFQEKTGIPLMPQWSGPKIRWLLENSVAVKQAVAKDRCLVGTIDCWLIWNLTGGAAGGVHITEPSNASGTALMELATCQWDPELCRLLDVPQKILPKIMSSSEVYGHLSDTKLKGCPLASALGDQQGALVGLHCLERGEAKMTYGTAGCMLVNAGTQPMAPVHGGMTMVGYQLGPNAPPTYIAEGWMMCCGYTVKWLRDNIGIINSSQEIESLAFSVEDSNGCYFVPAFSGMGAPYLDSTGTGLLIGLNQSTTKAHIARATLEAICFRTKEIAACMNAELGGSVVTTLRVGGGMTVNRPFLQLLADTTGLTVACPSNPETTALGAAMAAGAALGVWDLTKNPGTGEMTFYRPRTAVDQREVRFATWKKAVQRCLDWSSE